MKIRCNAFVSDSKTKLPTTEITNNGITVKMIDLHDIMPNFFNPNTGSLVIQDDEGKTQGQIEAWEIQTPKGPALFLDGMEFYDDSQYANFMEYMEYVALWAEASPYKNITMQLNPFEQKLFSEKGTNFVYTDTTNSEVYIKQDGKLASGFENTIEEREE